MKKMIFDTICIFLTIDFCENLQEYFFVRNQFLLIKIIKENTKILNKSFCGVKTQKITKITFFKPNVEALDINRIGQNFRFLLLRSKYITKKKGLKSMTLRGRRCTLVYREIDYSSSVV